MWPFTKRPQPVVINEDLLREIIDQLVKLRKDVQRGAVLSGVLSKLGPMDTEGKPAFHLLQIADKWEERIKD